MFDIPSARMDTRTGPNDFNRNNFSLYDMADEEVHFARHPSMQSAVAQHQSKTQPTASYEVCRAGFDDRRQLSGQLNGCAYMGLGGDGQTIYANDPTSRMAEQARSSRLLSSIGTKLKRGSNYLAAPGIVGSYLLGITIHSWVEFLDTSKMMKVPANTHHLIRRLTTNLSHFRGNYLCVALVLVIYCILTSPLLLIAIVAYLAAMYFVTSRSASGRSIKIVGYSPNLQQQYYFLTLVSLPTLWVAGAPSAVFWIIGASFVVVGLHASIYNLNAGSNQDGIANSTMQIASSLAQVGPEHYYNHYQARHYLPLQTPDTEIMGNSNSQQQVQWTIFRYLSGRDQRHKLASPEPVSNCAPKVPQVKIISQDFAGLGRVYEV